MGGGFSLAPRIQQSVPGGVVNRRISVLLITMASFMAAAAIPGNAETMLTHHVRPATINGQASMVGRLPVAQTLQLDVVLPLRDPDGLHNFLAELYSASIPNHVHFLTPKEFTERFGPTQQDYDTVVQYMQTHGLTVVGGSRDGMEVQVKGTVANIEAAFHVNLLTYQHPTENRIFFAPDREPTTDLSFALWHVSGLDNYSIPHPKYVSKAAYAQAHGVSPDSLVNHATTGSVPGQRHARSLLRRNGSDRLGREPRIVRVCRHRPRRPDHLLQEREADELRAGHGSLDRRHQHELCRFAFRWRLRRYRADARYDAGSRHGSRTCQPGDVRRLDGHGHHQLDDNAQSSSNHHRLLMGMDAG